MILTEFIEAKSSVTDYGSEISVEYMVHHPHGILEEDVNQVHGWFFELLEGSVDITVDATICVTSPVYSTGRDWNKGTFGKLKVTISEGID